MSAVRVFFVSDGVMSAGSTAAAIGSDPAIDLVGRAPDVGSGEMRIAEVSPQVVVLFTRQGDGAALDRMKRAAARARAAFVVVEAGRAPAESFYSIRRRVKAAALGEAGLAPPRAAPASAGRLAPLAARAASRRGEAKLIAIGASTGGVEALVTVMSGFPADCPPTVIVQHMPAYFTTSFAGRLDGVCAARVHEAWDQAPLERGVVYLAPGGAAHLEVAGGSARRVRLVESAPVNRHRPSVDVAFHSVARTIGSGAVGVLLTGMGRDGAEGLKAMRDAGARTIAQDKETSTVYGMPRAAAEIGAVDRGTPLQTIAQAIFSPESSQKETI